MNKSVGDSRAQGWPAWLALASFLIAIAVLKFSFHELWKDEWQAWLIATDTTFSQMMNLLPGEGHPALWFLLMRAASWVGHLFLLPSQDVWILQTLHFLLVASTLYIFFIHIRLRLWIKCGLAFSYFMFFEYGIINRSYILLQLFSFAYVALAQRDKNQPWLAGLVLFLICQVEVYGVMMAVALLAYEVWKNETDAISEKIKSSWQQIVWVVGGLLIFYFTVSTGKSVALADGQQIDWAWSAMALQAITFDTLFIGLLPTVLSQFNLIGFLCGVGVLTALFFLFRTSKSIIIAYGLFFAALLVFTFLIYHGGPRQWGVQLLFFVCMLSLLYADNKMPKWGVYFVAAIIFVQSIHNLKIIKKEVTYPFSNSMAAGTYIKKNIAASIPILGINKPYCTPVIGYVGYRFYSLPYGDSYSYFIWQEKQYIPSMADIENFATTKSVNRLMVINNKPMDLRHYTKLKPVKAFDNPNIREEYYFLYAYERN